MTNKENAVHKCADPKCGCEVEMTKAPAAGKGADGPLHCCCGKPMAKK